MNHAGKVYKCYIQPSHAFRRFVACIPIWATCVLLSSTAAVSSEAQDASIVTVRASIEMTRLGWLLSTRNPVIYSPDRRRYLIALIRGDLEKDGNWVELRSGRTDSLKHASVPKVVARLFTTSGALNPFRDAKNISWLSDNRRVAYLWNDGKSPAHIEILDTTNGDIEVAASHSTDITHFSISADARSIIYTAIKTDLLDPSRDMLKRGFAVGPQTSLSYLLLGYFNGRGPWNSIEVFTGTSGSPERRIWLEDQPTDLRDPYPTMSPDGNFAIIDWPTSNLPMAWDRYPEPTLRQWIHASRQHPEESKRVERLWLVNTRTGSAEAFWDAPVKGRNGVYWSLTGERVLLAPVFLPPTERDVAGDVGAAAVVFDLAGRKFLKVDLAGARWAFDKETIRWIDDTAFEAQASAQDVKNHVFRLDGAVFRERKGTSSADRKSTFRKPLVALEWRQSYMMAPILYAKDTVSGKDVPVVDLGEQLKGFQLGRVEIMRWKDPAHGTSWTGRLYYPIDYRPGAEYPLVIQNHPDGSAAKEYSLTGSDVISTAFAAQPLASRGIAVLQLFEPDGGMGSSNNSPRERELISGGYTSAIEHLNARGIGCMGRVGLVGFSRAGQYVEYAISRRSANYGAAVVADNYDAGYFEDVTTNAQIRADDASNSGGPSIGPTLESWMILAPGFNTDKIHTPLRMERDETGVIGALNSWEVFNNLRYQNKPVELFFIPDVNDGNHLIEKPRQILASQGGTVDWMDFWLKGHEDDAIEKRQQYQRWRALRLIGDIQ